VLLAHDHRDEAIVQFHEAIKLEPDDPGTYNDIAWDLATLPEAKQRDSKLAVEFATKACELTEWKEPAYLDTLSAAFAESGDFDAAVKWQTRAIELLTDKNEKGDYSTRFMLYQEKKPYRRPVP
jgi:tetratricopeptide (TPR) repeat protein